MSVRVNDINTYRVPASDERARREGPVWHAGAAQPGVQAVRADRAVGRRARQNEADARRGVLISFAYYAYCAKLQHLRV
eukprot:1183919-Prorocentrum_minimum.AAC.1